MGPCLFFSLWGNTPRPLLDINSPFYLLQRRCWIKYRSLRCFVYLWKIACRFESLKLNLCFFITFLKPLRYFKFLNIFFFFMLYRRYRYDSRGYIQITFANNIKLNLQLSNTTNLKTITTFQDYEENNKKYQTLLKK